MDNSEMEAYATPISREMMRVKSITDRISLSIFGIHCFLRVEKDMRNTDNGRIFVQVVYRSPCNKTGENEQWKGRKWYLSEFMLDDEIVKTCYAAFEAAVKHEILEGFRVDGIVLFNPHVNFEELLKISHNEVKRHDANTTGKV